MDKVSRKSATIFGQGTIPELSTSHIGKGVALVARAAAFVYIYARIPQIAEMTLKLPRNIKGGLRRPTVLPFQKSCISTGDPGSSIALDAPL
jgi:hypothetical protein